jgi:hypothetical protein
MLVIGVMPTPPAMKTNPFAANAVDREPAIKAVEVDPSSGSQSDQQLSEIAHRLDREFLRVRMFGAWPIALRNGRYDGHVRRV